MTIQDDETLKMYLEESLEHLADIENDFLAIEAGGADIDEDLVNKVYRAAHSIKGGAGFMGLTNIKDLTHEMENILGKIRSRKMIPEPDIVNILLMASDTLQNMMNDVLNSNNVDISEQIAALKAIAEGVVPLDESAMQTNESPPQEVGPNAAPDAVPDAIIDDTPLEKNDEIKQTGQKRLVQNDADNLEFSFFNGKSAFSVPENIIKDFLSEGKFVYLVELELIQDLVKQKKSPQTFCEEMQDTGTIIKSSPNIEAVADLSISSELESFPLLLLYSTILKPADIDVLFEIDKHRIFLLTPEMNIEAIASEPLVKVMGEAMQQEEIIDDFAISTQKEPAMSEQEIMPESDTFKPEKIKAVAPIVEPVIQEKPQIPIRKQIKAASPPKDNKPAHKIEKETSLRVHVSLLDSLMTLAGELVLSRNQLIQSMSSHDQRAAEIAGQRIDLITSELQEAIMLTRMQSVGNVFNKFPRVVRDLSKQLGKQVNLTLEGKDVELDKTIIEAIGDPLTHLVRNAVDHGVEIPEVRQQAGKNPEGRIILRAYHKAGQVNIEITDDGKGLDGEKLAQLAFTKGLITEDQIKIMSDKEKINLIFMPGFSTAEKVTDVSGRGVGMDVVKTNLDSLGGIVDIDSEPGKGSRILIKLPLTLAIIPCQIIKTGQERYAIPQVNLEELLRIPADKIKKRIEKVGDAEVVRLRGNLLPLIKLADIIGAGQTYLDPATLCLKTNRRTALADRRSKQSDLVPPDKKITDKASDDFAKQAAQRSDSVERRKHPDSALNIVVVTNGAMKYGLVVDQLLDSEEIVVKPLGRHLKNCKGYAGATIMGDGKVALILDVANLAQMADLTSVEGTARAAELADETSSELQAAKDRQSLLIFRNAEDEQFAAPLNQVERIEKIKATDIEDVGGKRVMKYRGASLPLCSIDEVAMVKPLEESDNLLVIVFILSGKEIGMLAMGPLDAIETTLEVDSVTLKQSGIMGSSIINGHTTLLIDIFEIVRTLNPDWFEEYEAVQTAKGSAATILFAEDSNFFRNQVKNSLEEEGYNVIEAEDGQIAWDLLQEKKDEISLVVTDIEMPNMNGFELSQNIKSSPEFARIPIIALTTLASDEDVARGKEVGINDYQIKLDREKLLGSVYHHLKDIES